jgi:catalase
MSSDAISPSRQQRSESIWNGRSTSKSLMPFALSLEQQIARQSRRRYTAVSMRLGLVRVNGLIVAELPMLLAGEAAHFDHRVDDDHWEQLGNLFRIMTSAQRLLLFENTTRAMGDARLHIKQRHVANCSSSAHAVD